MLRILSTICLALLSIASFSQVGRGAIVVTGASTIVETSAASDPVATFTLTINARTDAADPLGFFGFSVLLPTEAGTSSVHTLNREGVWNNFTPSPTLDEALLTVTGGSGALLTTYQGGINAGAVIATNPFEFGFVGTDRLATITFSVARTASVQNLNIVLNQQPAILPIPATGNGFFEDGNPGGPGGAILPTQLADDIGAGSSIAFQVGALTAVPEPSSMLLSGIAVLGLLRRRRR
ncbi:MAG: PEP-CTERM sorting domain-containing protein [Pirellulaceae bacterium]